MASLFTGAAAEFIARKYGGAVAETVGIDTVGVAAASVHGNDPERVFVLLVNLSVNSIFIGFDQSVSASRGILLASNGGTYQVDVEEDFAIPTRQLFAMATAAGSIMYVVTARRITRSDPAEV